MASVEANKLSKADHDELCCSYAALMLHDDGCEITVSLLYFKCFNVFSLFVGRKIIPSHHRLRQHR
jgi:hypothetical protein